MIEPSIKEVGSIYQEQPDLKTKYTMDQNVNKRGQGNVCSLNPMRDGENNKSKRRQREFIPSRLEICGLGIIT